jgi:DNA-binding HxlR family transcriptional regulator
VKRRSVCPIACTLDLLGDKWTLLVIRDLVLGRSQFKEFLASPEGIATNILTDRLNRLVENELVRRVSASDHAGRDHYVLTPKGKSLMPVLKAVSDWGLKNIPGAAARMSPKKS